MTPPDPLQALRQQVEKWHDTMEDVHVYLADECDFGVLDKHPACPLWERTLEAAENMQPVLAYLASALASPEPPADAPPVPEPHDPETCGCEDDADWCPANPNAANLMEQAHRLIAECSPYLKDGETPAECIARNRKDIDSLLTLLAREKAKNEARPEPDATPDEGTALDATPQYFDGLLRMLEDEEQESCNGNRCYTLSIEQMADVREAMLRARDQAALRQPPPEGPKE